MRADLQRRGEQIKGIDYALSENLAQATLPVPLQISAKMKALDAMIDQITILFAEE